MNTSSLTDNIIIKTLRMIFASMGRATVKFFREIPTKVKSRFVLKINEFKSRPKRTEMNKIYVLVGYTTKQHVENKYRTEHMLITVRRVLLIIILLELFLITINKVVPLVDFSQYQNIFGISSIDDMTNNDPFTNESKETESSIINIDN